MITTAFTRAIRSLSRLSPARSASRGISVCIAAEKCSLVRWLAVDENRDLQFQDVTIFAEAKSHQLHAADVARFPLGSLEWLLRFVGWPPFPTGTRGAPRVAIRFVNP